MRKAFPLQKSKRIYILLTDSWFTKAWKVYVFWEASWNKTTMLPASTFQWQEWEGSLCPLDHMDHHQQTLVFSVPSLNISFIFLLHWKPASSLGSSHVVATFFHVLGNIKPASKIGCGISVCLASPPTHSLFFLTKILWLWISYQLTTLPITSSYCSHPPDFNSWLTATLFNAIAALILRSKSRWMILPIF